LKTSQEYIAWVDHGLTGFVGGNATLSPRSTSAPFTEQANKRRIAGQKSSEQGHSKQNWRQAGATLCCHRARCFGLASLLCGGLCLAGAKLGQRRVRKM